MSHLTICSAPNPAFSRNDTAPEPHRPNAPMMMARGFLPAFASAAFKSTPIFSSKAASLGYDDINPSVVPVFCAQYLHVHVCPHTQTVRLSASEGGRGGQEYQCALRVQKKKRERERERAKRGRERESTYVIKPTAAPANPAMNPNAA